MEDVPPPVLTEDQVRALLRVTGGRDFESRRDHAIFRLWLDTGLRRSELAGLRVEDVDFGYGVVRVLGKGRQVRGSPGTIVRLPLRVREGCSLKLAQDC